MDFLATIVICMGFIDRVGSFVLIAVPFKEFGIDEVDREAPCLSWSCQFLSLTFSLRLLESHQTEAAYGQSNTHFKISSHWHQRNSWR